MRNVVLVAVAAFGLVAATSASAAVQVFDFVVVEAGKGLGVTPGNFGSVTVTEDAGDLLFDYSLAAGYRIHQGNANHDAFAFSLVSSPVVTISNLPANFARKPGAGPFPEPPLGDFGYAITYAGNPAVAGKGYADGFAGPLTFRVDAGATNLTLASLASRPISMAGNTYNVFFSSDIVNTGGYTANVGAIARPPVRNTFVPEPATWAMMIIGFGGVGALLRRRRMATA